MAFPRSIVLAVIAASAALLTVEAFAPAGRSIANPTLRVAGRECSPLASSITSIAGDELNFDEPVPDTFVIAEKDDIENMDELEDEDAVDTDEDDSDLSIPGRFLSKQRMEELRVKHRRHENDSGSPEFQVAGITERITHLTQHLKEHPKDFSTRRGLVALVNKRRRLLNYLYQEDEKAYIEIVAALGIRHKVPGAIPTKEDTYGRYPSAKPNKGKSTLKINKANAKAKV